MRVRLVFLFSFFYLVHCARENYNSSPQNGGKTFENSQSTFRDSSLSSNTREVNKGSEQASELSSRLSNQGPSQFSNNGNTGSYGESGREQLSQSTNYNQREDFRPVRENNFSGKPAEGSTFGQPSGFGSGNQGSSGRPSGSSNFGQSGGLGSGNQGSSGRPSGSSNFGQSGGFGSSNEGLSGRPSGSSNFGQSGGLGSGNQGSSGRPSGGSNFGQSNGSGSDNQFHSGRPNEKPGFGHEGQTGSVTQRPNSNKESEHSSTGINPDSEQNKGTDDGKEDEKDVCFPNLGCFKMGKPWSSTLRPVSAPDAPEKIQTVVHFYSRENPKQPENITVYPQINLGRARFSPQKISTIIVHGFSNSGNATWMKEMKDVYLRKVDANVMIVDWGKGAQQLSYLQVAGNTRVVGKQLGTFVKYLIEKHGADPGKFHLIGHSLGAQICSYLAKDVPGIARLTALDPAQPGFEGFSKEVRLDKTDAEFVDVIHTDARPFIPTLGFGMIAPHGHVDFYMNGGFDQPGCVPPPKKDIPAIKSFLDFAKFPVEVLVKAVACPHARAYEYLIEAFNETDNCIFWGHKADAKNVFKTVTNTVTQGLLKKFTALSTTCSKDNCIPLGFATKKSPLRGIFVVTTGGRQPYCISEPGVPPETLPQDRKEKSLFEKIREAPILG